MAPMATTDVGMALYGLLVGWFLGAMWQGLVYKYVTEEDGDDK